jgi:hypothetical protein
VTPDAARLLENLQGDRFRGDLTVADAASRIGISLDKAQAALFGLLAEYPGKLVTTSEGELVFSFPKGLAKKRDERGFFRKAWDKAKGFVKGAARFVLRAWITIAILAYVVIFAAILIALALRGGDDDSPIGGLGDVLLVLLRVAFEALWWTFHPFSPFSHAYYEPRFARRQKKKKDDTPFYEKVNRFVFGAEPAKVDPELRERQLIAEIRAQKGRIGVSDVMRITGLSREEADVSLARLMLDYDGEVEVSEDGGITYTFPRLRYTAEGARGVPRRNVWDELRQLPALTGGNTTGSNVLIAGLNLFNLIAGLVAYAGGFTIEKIIKLIEGVPPELLPQGGTAIALGVVPIFFSLWILAMPIWRAVTRVSERRKVQRENGRRGLLKRVLARLNREKAQDQVHFSEQELEVAFKAVAGREPSRSELRDELLELGADLDTAASDDGIPRWRFVDLEAEVKALADARAQTEAAELGEVVYEVESAR